MTISAPLVPRRRAAIAHPVTAVLAGGVLFGTAGVAQAWAPVSGSPLSVGLVRLGMGAVSIVGYLILRGLSLRAMAGLWRSPMTILAAVCAAAYQPFFFGGIAAAGVPVATLVAVGSTPVFTGLLSWLVRGERPGRRWLMATAVCVAGLGLLTGVESRAGTVLGVLLAAGAGLASGSFTVLAKRLLERGVPTLQLLGASLLLGSLLMLPLVAVADVSWTLSPAGALLAAYLGVVTMGLANILLVRGLGSLPAPTAATLTLADPLTATVLGAALIGQVLSPGGLLGLGVLFTGIVLQGVWSTRHPS